MAEIEQQVQTGEVVLEVRGLTTRWLHDVSFQLHPGEVLGLTGLVGSGYEDAVYAIFGAIPADSLRAGQDQESEQGQHGSADHEHCQRDRRVLAAQAGNGSNDPGGCPLDKAEDGRTGARMLGDFSGCERAAVARVRTAA